MNEENNSLSLSKEQKTDLIKKYTPKTKTSKTVTLAFIFGGIIAALGEMLRHLFLYLGVESDTAPTLVSLVFVLLASILTSLGIFSKIAKSRFTSLTSVLICLPPYL